MRTQHRLGMLSDVFVTLQDQLPRVIPYKGGSMDEARSDMWLMSTMAPCPSVEDIVKVLLKHTGLPVGTCKEMFDSKGCMHET